MGLPLPRVIYIFFSLGETAVGSMPCLLGASSLGVPHVAHAVRKLQPHLCPDSAWSKAATGREIGARGGLSHKAVRLTAKTLITWDLPRPGLGNRELTQMPRRPFIRFIRPPLVYSASYLSMFEILLRPQGNH